MKTFGIACVVVVFFIAFGVLGFVCHVTNTAQNSVTGVIDKTLDSDNVIYNYEYFHQSFNDIKAMDDKIINAQKQSNQFDSQFTNRKDMDREDKSESDRLHAILEGLKQERENMISTYNARSSMANRNIFQGKDLPTHINP